jgi:KaiC/GvpD/RAD55 family RecA-like ATPase
MDLLIRDLIQFEKVEEVIKLRKEEKTHEYVEKYVISESLQRNLLYMLEVLSSPTHKSFNVVGNYGTGKSHFLAFAAAILEQPDLRSQIQDDEVRAAAQRLDRRMLVVRFELGAAAEVSLRHIFFDQVYHQLLDRYDIEVPVFDLATAYDNKQNVLDLLTAIKAEDPEAGLVVVVDEISDFLKQKSKEEMAYDLALLRELGEVSQDSDFLYIGAMQEHVFTNPKYVDQAESIARINQRFVTVTITKEDVAQVLTQRVVRKDAEQRHQLVDLLEEHRQYFPNVAQQQDRYVDLFPIHPYVIDVFERLPYFENRGIIGFAVNNVTPILDRPAPRFITYERVFDLINETHEIRNQPSVAQVVKAVETLESKADLLNADYREDARKLIKALAVLNLLGGGYGHGATSQELANTLLITPPRQLLLEPGMARGHIERVMMKIREVTVGQFIAYHGDGRYALDLTIVEDFDARIEQKARAAVNAPEIERAFCTFAETGLGYKDQKLELS